MRAFFLLGALLGCVSFIQAAVVSPRALCTSERRIDIIKTSLDEFVSGVGIDNIPLSDNVTIVVTISGNPLPASVSAQVCVGRTACLTFFHILTNVVTGYTLQSISDDGNSVVSVRATADFGVLIVPLLKVPASGTNTFDSACDITHIATTFDFGEGSLEVLDYLRSQGVHI